MDVELSALLCFRQQASGMFLASEFLSAWNPYLLSCRAEREIFPILVVFREERFLTLFEMTPTCFVHVRRVE